MSGCSGMLRPSAFTWYWQKAKNSFSFWGKRALCSKKVCVVKFSQKGTFFLSDHFCHKSMMMMVFWPHIYNCLAYMASLAKKYFWSNVLNRSLLIAEGGTYAKIIYVEKIILCDVFQKWSKKFKFSRNRKHHEKRLKKTLVVMFSDFLPDPRGAGLHLAFQFSYVRPSVRPSVRPLVSEIKFWSLHIH